MTAAAGDEPATVREGVQEHRANQALASEYLLTNGHMGT